MTDKSKKLPAFEKFIQDLRAAWVDLPDIKAAHGTRSGFA